MLADVFAMPPLFHYADTLTSPYATAFLIFFRFLLMMFSFIFRLSFFAATILRYAMPRADITPYARYY